MKKTPSLKMMKTVKEDIAKDLHSGLSARFNGVSFNVGHGVAKDKDENLSYYFRIYAPGGNAKEIEEFSNDFIATKRPGAPVIVKVTDLPLSVDDNPAIFDIGIAYVGPGIRKKM